MVTANEEAQYKAEFPRLFGGLGKLQDPYKIRLRDQCLPYAVTAPPHLALPLRKKVKAELEQLEQQGVICSISKPTDWCEPIVVVPKSHDIVRVCVDLKPEVFQKRMGQLLDNQVGVICDIDDLLIFGKIKQDHDLHLKRVMATLQLAGVTLNGDKCQFAKDRVRFLRHVISKEGIAIDRQKLAAIREFPRPQNVSELRRLLEIVNHVSKFAGPTLADDSKALRDLLKQDMEWTWDAAQEAALQKIRNQLIEAPVLAHYSADRKTVISADASCFGLGAVFLQKQSDGHLKPVFYASRSMTDTERRYAQVEREALAVTWACEKFSDDITGLHELTIETDHKPLLALLKTTSLEDLPARIQRFRMRLMRFTYSIEYTRRKNLVLADALSPAPVGQQEPDEKKQEEMDDPQPPWRSG
ncbi:hypothetical protein ACOMHN_023327 [Nucella lapillus]